MNAQLTASEMKIKLEVQTSRLERNNFEPVKPAAPYDRDGWYYMARCKACGKMYHANQRKKILLHNINHQAEQA